MGADAPGAGAGIGVPAFVALGRSARFTIIRPRIAGSDLREARTAAARAAAGAGAATTVAGMCTWDRNLRQGQHRGVNEPSHDIPHGGEERGR